MDGWMVCPPSIMIIQLHKMRIENGWKLNIVYDGHFFVCMCVCVGVYVFQPFEPFQPPREKIVHRNHVTKGGLDWSLKLEITHKDKAKSFSQPTFARKKSGFTDKKNMGNEMKLAL